MPFSPSALLILETRDSAACCTVHTLLLECPTYLTLHILTVGRENWGERNVGVENRAHLARVLADTRCCSEFSLPLFPFFFMNLLLFLD